MRIHSLAIVMVVIISPLVSASPKSERITGAQRPEAEQVENVDCSTDSVKDVGLRCSVGTVTDTIPVDTPAAEKPVVVVWCTEMCIWHIDHVDCFPVCFEIVVDDEGSSCDDGPNVRLLVDGDTLWSSDPLCSEIP